MGASRHRIVTLRRSTGMGTTKYTSAQNARATTRRHPSTLHTSIRWRLSMRHSNTRPIMNMAKKLLACAMG